MITWHGQDQLSAAMNVYVEEALGLHVGELVRFVRAALRQPPSSRMCLRACPCPAMARPRPRPS